MTHAQFQLAPRSARRALAASNSCLFLISASLLAALIDELVYKITMRAMVNAAAGASSLREFCPWISTMAVVDGQLKAEPTLPTLGKGDDESATPVQFLFRDVPTRRGTCSLTTIIWRDIVHPRV